MKASKKDFLFNLNFRIMLQLKTFNFDKGIFVYQYETHNNKVSEIYEYCQKLNDFLKSFNDKENYLNFSLTYLNTSLTRQIIFNLTYKFTNKIFDVCCFDVVSRLTKQTIDFAIGFFYDISYTYDKNNWFYKFKKETIDKGIDYNLNGDNYCFIKLFDADNLSGFIMQDTDY